MSSIATSALIMIALFALLLLVRRDMAPRVVLSLSVLLLLQAVGESGNIKPLATAASQLMIVAPVMIAAEPVPVSVSPAAELEISDAVTVAITLVNGRHLVVPAGIDPVILARLLPVLDSA